MSFRQDYQIWDSTSHGLLACTCVTHWEEEGGEEVEEDAAKVAAAAVRGGASEQEGSFFQCLFGGEYD